MVNRDHPDFPEYKREWDEMMEWYNAEDEKLTAANQSNYALIREYHKKIREIQTKYSHIITFEYERRN